MCIRDSNPPEPGKKEFKYGLYTYREGDKVMQVRNNYDIEWKKDGESGQGIFNGDIGYITKINRAAGVMQVLFDGRTATYTTEMAKELDVYKRQFQQNSTTAIFSESQDCPAAHEGAGLGLLCQNQEFLQGRSRQDCTKSLKPGLPY